MRRLVNQAPRAILVIRATGERAPGGHGMTGGRSARPVRRHNHRPRRRELLFLLAGAATLPRALRAQQKAKPVIGWLSNNLPDLASPGVVAFRRGLSETGYVEGQNVAIGYRLSEGR